MDNLQYYRNNVDIITTYEEIETDSLWYRKNEVMILVDDDRHVEYPYNPMLFREVTI